LPNQIGNQFQNLNIQRDIDVLIQARKSSEYLIKELIPALQQQCKVLVVDSYIEDLGKLFNQAKVYLYDSAEYWAQQAVSEGFGMQPLEALACGCQVFSSINGGLSDYLDPGFNCNKIAGYSKEYDVKRILKALEHPSYLIPEHILAEYRIENINQRFQVIIDELNDFFDHKMHDPSKIKSLTAMRITKLRTKKIFDKLKKKYFSK
jgi:glycosyltransferase involved in cell wall biosynthesis